MIGQDTLMNYVGGQWEASAAGQTIPVRNPATGEVIVGTWIDWRMVVGEGFRRWTTDQAAAVRKRFQEHLANEARKRRAARKAKAQA